jgi:hypothetical protein
MTVDATPSNYYFRSYFSEKADHNRKEFHTRHATEKDVAEIHAAEYLTRLGAHRLIVRCSWKYAALVVGSRLWRVRCSNELSTFRSPEKTNRKRIGKRFAAFNRHSLCGCRDFLTRSAPDLHPSLSLTERMEASTHFSD